MKIKSGLLVAIVVASLGIAGNSTASEMNVYQKTLSPFPSATTSLSVAQKAQIQQAVSANPNAEKFICTGIRFESDPASVSVKVRARAKAACDYAKTLNPSLSVWFQNKPTKAKSFSGKVLLTVKSPLGELTLSEVLNTLRVASEADSESYERSKFADWLDADKDGCSTRIEVLQAEGVFFTSPTGCSIVGGTWLSKYDLVETGDASSFDIDHMVPLAEAWRSGASTWDQASRDAYSNDLGFSESLIAVSASSNRSKGDKDPSQWMPANSSFKCQYLTAFVLVKYRWGLSVDSNEKASITNQGADCLEPITLPNKAKVATVPTSPPTPPSETNDPRFSTCKAAKAAGYGPYVKGKDPEYAWYRDTDNDGIVCE